MMNEQRTTKSGTSAQIRKKGILMLNKDQLNEEEPHFQAERKGDNKLFCTSCSGFYSSKTFYKHNRECNQESKPSGVPVENLSSAPNQLFEADILSRIHNDAIGKVVKNDPTILCIGRRLYDNIKRKVDLEQESRRSVMADMRLLGRLYIAFRDHQPSTSAACLFARNNFETLELAIQEITCNQRQTDREEPIKYGTKYKIYYLLRNSAMILKGTHRSKLNDAAAQEIDYFLEILKLNHSSIFGDATYAINKTRSEKLRTPEQMPEERDVAVLRNHIKHQIQQQTSMSSLTTVNFVNLRNALCARLTLFNGRRGNEASRMTLDHWRDAKSKRWLHDEQIQELDFLETKLVEDHLICFLRGKGGKQVPVLIPSDCRDGMEKLCDPETRRASGVDNNKFLFASTGQSANHVEGWHCIAELCNEAGVADATLLTATKQRHRISTKYAALDLSTADRELFYAHMGHREIVNKNTYQHPLAVKSIVKVGKRLREFDQGKLKMNVSLIVIYQFVFRTRSSICTIQFSTIQFSTSSRNWKCEYWLVISQKLHCIRAFLAHEKCFLCFSE